jgi:cyclopropane-fatty-acyl-phospholipid synthase
VRDRDRSVSRHECSAREGFKHDYARTLREWIANLDEHLEEAERLAGPERLRVWRLYLRAARHGFDVDFTSVYQVLAHRV